MILSLNLFPPSQVDYEVNSEVVLSSSQIETLQRIQHDGETDFGKGMQVSIAAFESKVVEPSTELLLASDAGNDGRFSLLNAATRNGAETRQFTIRSIWKQRCTAEAHEAWVRELAEPDLRELRETKVARSQRFARWEVKAAEHYLERQNYLHTQNDESGSSKQVRAKLASFRSSESLDPSIQAARENLVQQLGSKRAEQFRAEEELKHEFFEAKAQYRIVGEPQVRMRYSYVPLLFLISTFAVGIFSGASAGLIHWRAQSGGSFSPSAIADHLAMHGLPIAGMLKVKDVTRSVSLSQRIAEFWTKSRRFATNSLISVGEWTIAFWVLLLALRCSTDSMWRQFLVEQPLIAIANLLIGLP